MFNWEVNIEKVSNGYIIGEHHEDDEGNPYIEKTIVEKKEEVYDKSERVEELKAFQNMIWELAEYFGVTLHTKHEKINLEMKITGTKEEEDD